MIKVLEKQISDKIAAGEVIERPVSIIKELVENSIDAGASSITVDIKDGGKSYIRVTDNGIGIPKDEVETAFLRHATSKIESAVDLDSIETLGFRGEALASIAAVTRTDLVTKTRDSKLGTQVKIHGSNVVANNPVGCPDGTTIVVEDLFYNTPARAKFLKNKGVEAGQILDFMSQIALTRPDIKFRVVSNVTVMFSTAGNGDLLAAILEIYKSKELETLVPVNYEQDNVKVYGYISRPSLSRNSRRSMYFFVNGRVVNSKVIDRGLMEGYKERLFEGRYPVAYLFIETKPELLDVNIHPNKKEVRFDDDSLIIEVVKNGVTEALMSLEAMAENSAPKEEIEAEVDELESKGKQVNDSETSYSQSSDSKNGYNKTSSSKTSYFEDKSLVDDEKPKEKAQVDIKQLLSTMRQEEEDKEALETLESQELLQDEGKLREGLNEDEAPESKEDKVEDVDLDKDESSLPHLAIEIPKLKPFDIDQIHFDTIVFDTYIIATDNDNFYLIDQHAAHERIFYEQLVSQYEDEKKHSQMILAPFTFDVPLGMLENSSVWGEILSNMGYDIEIFGETTFIVREIPGFMSLDEAEEFINKFVDEYDVGVEIPNQVVIDKLITRSCKSAIKAHDIIDKKEAESLLETLKGCRNPFSCPHGRPTFVRFSNYEIERMFKRA